MIGNIQPKVIILLDIENILFSSLDRAGRRFPRRDFVALILETIREIARGYGPIGYEYAAIAVPSEERESLPSDSGWYKTRREIMQLVFVLIDLGVHVITVPRGPDAADFALCQIGESVLDDLYVNAVILATGDGNEPFLSFIDKAHEKKKKVCVVAYDRIPKFVKERPVERVLLANKLCARLPEYSEERVPEAMSTAFAYFDETNTGKRKEEVFSFDVPQMNEYKTLFDQLNAGDFAIDMPTFLKCVDAVWILKGECSRSAKGGRFSAPYLEKRLMAKMKEILPGITLHEVRRLLFVLIEHSDFFFRSDAYTYSSGNQLERQLDAYREKSRDVGESKQDA